MADYQNNMRSMRRPVRSSFSSSQTCPRRMGRLPGHKRFLPGRHPACNGLCKVAEMAGCL